MTASKIKTLHHKISACKKSGCFNEALIISYHHNLELILFILDKAVPNYPAANKKINTICKDLFEEISVNPKLKSIITKKNFKGVKVWLKDMDLYFKTLKLKLPNNSKHLLTESEGVHAVLNISVKKLISKKSA
jgi:hypothetical protein